jgi:hypothetical protein
MTLTVYWIEIWCPPPLSDGSADFLSPRGDGHQEMGIPRVCGKWPSLLPGSLCGCPTVTQGSIFPRGSRVGEMSDKQELSQARPIL